MIDEVYMPTRIAGLPRDKRGYPIPWNVLTGTDGNPIFTVNDSGKHWTALVGELCPICGEILDPVKWFVGGPRSAFDPNGWYFDLPGHQTCIEYALQVCPYLAMRSYQGRIDVPDISKVKPGTLLLDETQDPNHPNVFVAVASQDIIVQRNGDVKLPYVRPAKPYIDVSYWADGKRLSIHEGQKRVAQALGKIT